MIHIFAYGIEEEMGKIRDMLTEFSIQRECLEYEFKVYQNIEDWKQGMENVDWIDFMIVDVAQKEAVSMAVEIKKRFPKTGMIPVADASILPCVYVRPELSPITLLWRPLDTQANKDALLQVLLSLNQPNEKGDVFYISTRQKTQGIPYDCIFYFEARDKKLYVRTEHQEISFAGTLSQLESTLSNTFIRCHKGYLINKNKIWAVDWSRHLVQLGASIVLPVSRNYQNKLREAYHEG